MINRLEGYTGDGFNQRRAYIGSNNGMNFINDKKALEEKVKKEQELKELKKNNLINQKNNTLNQMNSLMHNNIFNNNINH